MLKQLMLGSGAGRLALFMRDKIGLLHTAFFHGEYLGQVSNDQLATRLITRICRPRTVFIDVGAHIGSVVSEVALSNASVSIVAIEAIPQKADALKRKFRSIQVHACAAGEATGTANFFINTRASGYSSLAAPSGAAAASFVQISVPIRRLDDILPEHGIDALKIDVEGAELGVLRGAVNTIARNRPTIMFESGPRGSEELGYTKEALHEFLTSQAYSILVPNRVAHLGEGLTLAGFIDSHLYPRRTLNYFAVANERRAEIRERAREVLAPS